MTQTKKLRAVTFNKTPIFGDKAKVFVREDDKWLPYPWEQMLKLTVKDLLDYKMRFIVEFIFGEDGTNKKIRICSHKQDVAKLAAKYPSDFTLNLMSVLRIFKHDLEEKDGQEVGRILFCVSELGAEIVRT